MSKKLSTNQNELYTDIKYLIEEARSAVGKTINLGMTLMYWNIGKRINEELLQNERVEYGKAIVATVSRQLSWSHFIELITLKTELEREFYAKMCRIERWNVRILREKIRSMLFERTAISQKPEDSLLPESFTKS